jgi:hypothetical protein
MVEAMGFRSTNIRSEGEIVLKCASVAAEQKQLLKV